jgi:hypothetical protein
MLTTKQYKLMNYSTSWNWITYRFMQTTWKTDIIGFFEIHPREWNT